MDATAVELADLVLLVAGLGIWVWAAVDVAVSDATAVRGLRKPGWAVVLVLTGAVGALVWVAAGRPVTAPGARALNR